MALDTEIIVSDNVLDVEAFEIIKYTLTSDSFPWFYVPYKTYDPDPSTILDPELNTNLWDFQFTHMFYRQNEGWSTQYRNLLNPLLSLLRPSAIVRIKSNLTLATGLSDIPEWPLHTDYQNENMLTAIYYVNTTNGPTVINENQKIDCVANRLVIFPSSVPHAASPHNDKQIRCVINFNYFPQ